MSQGGSGGPLYEPLAHQGVADSAIILRILAQTKSLEEGIEAVKKNKETFIDPELAMVASNTIARKAAQVMSGPVTDAIIRATEKETVKAVTKRAENAFGRMMSGKSLSDVVRELESEKVRKIETRTASLMGQRMGKKIEIKIKKLCGGARRPTEFVRKYYGFDIDADVEATIEGKTVLLEGLSHKVIPDAVLNQKKELYEVIPIAALPILELCMSPHTIINITVPVAVACAMNKTSPKKAAREAEEAAYITASIPGAKSRARKVGGLVLQMMGDA